MGREITTGAYWFYRRQYNESGMNMDIVLQDSVDGAVLQTAALEAIKRKPFLLFTFEKSEDGRQYLLVKNNRPFFAVRNSGFVNYDSPTSNGYLWSLGYDENHIYLSIFHGLTDGLGLVSVAKLILRIYFSILTEGSFPQGQDDFADAVSGESDYADPFEYARPCERRYTFRVPQAFLAEPESADTYVPYQKRIALSLQEVLDVSKQTEGSISGVHSLIMARAVDRMNGGASTCIVVKCPINLRQMLGCVETMQNCVSSVHYVYSQKLKKMPFTQQASCFKGMLMIQSSEEYQMNNFYEWRSEVLRFNRELTMEEKRAALSTSKGIYPMVSYLERITLGEYDRYLKSVNITLDIGGGIGMIAFSLEDRLYMSLEMSEKKRAFLRNMTDELDALGISYTVE